MLSYWEQQYLTSYDTIIVGAGVAGLFTALLLKEKFPKERIIVLDKAFFPAASTKNAGFACMGSLSELEDDVQTQSMDAVLALFEKRFRGLALLRATLGDDCIGYSANGSYELVSKRDIAVLDKLDDWNASLHAVLGQQAFAMADIGQTQFRGFVAMTKNLMEGEINTGLMWHALCDKVRACGVQVMMHTPVLAHEKSGTTYTVMLDDNVRLRCRRLIFCANAFMQQLLPSLSVVPARGQVLISKPISGLPFKGIYHFDRGYYYFREIDGRVLFGGGRQLDKAGETTMQQGLNKQILEDLKLKLQEMILPGVPVAVDTCWSGIMGFSDTKLPICQDLGDNCFVLAGFGGMGVALAPYMAKELVGMIS